MYVGQKLFGFCSGWFGRDAYLDKRIEGIGADWVVARDTAGVVWLATGKDIHAQLEQWAYDSSEDVDE